jgi:hypothetical protein
MPMGGRRSRSLFRHNDVVRLVLATRAAGVEVARVEIDSQTGTIIVIAGKSEPLPVDAE